jgi:hypothetical protein
MKPRTVARREGQGNPDRLAVKAVSRERARHGGSDYRPRPARLITWPGAGPRTCKKPQTGEPVKIRASNTVAFKPDTALEDSINPQ